MGKGTGAALLTASLHAYLSTYCERPIALAELIGCLNRSIATQCDGQIFVTLFALIIRLPDFEVEYCNAGHNEVILVRADGSVEQLKEGGTLLGAMPDYPYASRTVAAAPRRPAGPVHRRRDRDGESGRGHVRQGPADRPAGEPPGPALPGSVVAAAG